MMSDEPAAPKSRGAAGAVLLVVVLLMGACATTEDHTLLSQRVKTLETERQALEAKMADDVKRLEELNDTIKRSEATLRKSGANLGLRVSQMEQSLPKVAGRLEVSEHRHQLLAVKLARVERLLVNRFDAVALLLPADLPSDANGLWSAGQGMLKKGEERKARAVFEMFEASHPKDSRAMEARVARAEIFARAGDFQRALNLYAKIEKLYPQASGLSKAVLRIGELFVKLGNCKKAKALYRYVARKYAESPEAGHAETRRLALKEACPK